LHSLVTLRLIGRVESGHVGELRDHIRSHHVKVVVDLDEVRLVDVSVVRFLVTCEGQGVELLNCPPYIREWMGRERSGGRGQQ
jgi:hypothetical protein